MTQFNTVGELRKFLDHYGDDQVIIGQIMANDGSHWYMAFDIKASELFVTITLSHPNLKTLKYWEDI